ncbi:hypothetical protein QAD02_021365 [Eretmocerus hayati]|uniref:Uncharacterized protein n=1 Tax=Eretmocerus hayati TaxID=131215 RepID=A0ACC2PT80_9HYME|nr:hypothetical protein QAD02_021365 [Eretmocerus hayati]
MADLFDSEAQKFQDDPTVPDHSKKLGALLKTSHSLLQSQLTRIDSRMTVNETENARAFASLRADIVATRTQVDPCEVRFSGIPLSVTAPDGDVITAILRAIECADRVSAILSIRRWPTRPARPQNRASNANPALGTGPLNDRGEPVRNQQADKIALVAKFCSPIVRDFVLSSAFLLKDKTAQDIFGSDGDAKVYLNSVLPPPVYKIQQLSSKLLS